MTGKAHKQPREGAEPGAARRAATAAVVLSLWIPFVSGAGVTLIGADGATAAIEAPEMMTPQEAQAVEDFRRALGKMAGGKAAEAAEGAADGRVVLERTDEAPTSLADAEAFHAQAQDGVLRLRAKTPEGICQAVYWFLREHGGARWYAPGEGGEYVPEKRPWTLPDFSKSPVPSFVSRVIWGPDEKQGALWKARNGLGNAVAFSHNLKNIVTDEVLREYPQWRGIFAGRPTPDIAGAVMYYQPELHVDACAQRAATAAFRHFEANPQSFSFSLGLEDNLRFSQSEAEIRARGPLRFFRGLPVYSDVVFHFVDVAATTMGMTKYADKTIGTLAYAWNTDTPSFALAPNIAPFVCSDRSFWHSQAFRDEETALLGRWNAAGTRLFGIYDYLYGDPFLIPRPLESAPEWIAAAHKAGARAYFAEAVPAEAYDYAKLWGIAAALWNVGADAGALRRQWYAHMYGNAAEDVAAFFRLWETAWKSQKRNMYWLRGYTNEEHGLLAAPGQLDSMRSLLDEAARKAQGGSAWRVAALRAHFEVSNAFCREVRAKAALVKTTAVGHARDAARLREELLAFFSARASVRDAAMAARWGDFRQKTDRADPSVGAAIRLEQWARAGGQWGAARRWLRRAAELEGATDAFRDIVAARTRTTGAQGGTNLLSNPEFKETRGQTPDDFNPLWKGYGGRLPAAWHTRSIRTPSLAVEVRGAQGGRKVMRVDSAANTHLFQWVAATGEPILFSVDVRGEVPEGCLVQLIVSGTANGRPFAREARLFAGDFKKGATLWMTSPPQKKGEPCAIGVIVAHQLPGQPVEISRPSASPAWADAQKTPGLIAGNPRTLFRNHRLNHAHQPVEQP